MQRLRSLHLYLGCIFAPMLLFFAISGLWQTFGLHRDKNTGMARLSSIHTMQEMHYKNGTSSGSLYSPAMRVAVVAMSLAFILTTVLGVVMAFKYGRSRRAAISCIAFGIVCPMVFVAIKMWT